MKKRPELKVVIASATLDAEMFKDYFNANPIGDDFDRCAILSIEGRQYPVNIQYLAEPSINYRQSAIDAVISIHKTVLLNALCKLIDRSLMAIYLCSCQEEKISIL
jgi:HrpA-like RNA helicase